VVGSAFLRSRRIDRCLCRALQMIYRAKPWLTVGSDRHFRARYRDPAFCTGVSGYPPVPPLAIARKFGCWCDLPFVEQVLQTRSVSLTFLITGAHTKL
jgi:hypothetical protein